MVKSSNRIHNLSYTKRIELPLDSSWENASGNIIFKVTYIYKVTYILKIHAYALRDIMSQYDVSRYYVPRWYERELHLALIWFFNKKENLIYIKIKLIYKLKYLRRNKKENSFMYRYIEYFIKVE